MKKLKLFGLASILLSISLVACGQKQVGNSASKADKMEVPKQEATLEMNADSLDARVQAELAEAILKQKEEMTKEALGTISQTTSILRDIDSGDTVNAIKRGKELIGALEVLLAKDPSLALLPVDVSYENEALVADIGTVKGIVKMAETAMEAGYYQEARELLKDLKSEMVVNTFYIPTATYPQALKAAVIMLEEGKTEEAKNLLISTLNTIVIEKNAIPIPVLKAEQMVIEAALVDAKDHEHVSKVLNLLNNADYQLKLAEALGYGKRDKEFAALATAIDELKASVEKKQDSSGKFNDLKEKIKSFRERLFPYKGKTPRK